ncbi:MAG: outer membrane protein assembly factor BamD, partial [Alphaproteobacteria bacterium]
IQLHPTSPDAPYAYYLKALAYYEQIVDVGRDQRTTEEALDALEDVVRRFPETQYARDASLKLDLTRDHLAGKEMEVGRFYLKRGEILAAINRFKQVIENHQTTSHVPEALLRLSEAYTALGLDNEARRMTAILGYNYPGSPWYADAYELVEGVQLANFPRPDERSFYERWFDPDATIAKAERKDITDLLPEPPKAATEVAAAATTEPSASGDARAVEREALKAADAAGAAKAEMARAEPKAARPPEPAAPKLTASERAALAAEAESQALAARE